jgi:hypothetical protein
MARDGSLGQSERGNHSLGRSLENDAIADWRESGDALPDVSAKVRSELGPQAAARFANELLEFQRRRAFVYAVTMALFIAPFFVMDLWESMESARAADRLQPVDVADPVLDGVLILFHAVFAALFQRVRGSRDRLMRLFLGLLIGVGSMIVLFVWWSTQGGSVLDPVDRGTWMEPFVFGSTAIFCAGFAHLFASFFVALSPREALIPVIPITVAYILTMLSLVNGPPITKAWMIAAWPLAAGPGLLWSTWRYRTFVHSFRWRVLRNKLGDLHQELVDARRIHESLFPAPMLDGAARFDYAYEPMREIGGDYLFARRHADGRIVMAVVDIVGHGVAAALAANRVHGELERLFEDRPNAGPGEIITLLNRFIARSLAAQGIFASAFAVELDGDRLRWTNAGHPSGLLVRADGTIEACPATAIMLGVAEPAEFDPGERAATLGRGDGVLCCTDGVHEARDARGELFGEARLLQLVTDARVGGADRMVPAIVESVRRYRDGDAHDDVLVAALWRHA